MDIVEELKSEAFNDTYDVGSDRVTVSSKMLCVAAAEIERLRITSGETGMSFREIKQEIKNGPSLSEVRPQAGPEMARGPESPQGEG